MSGGAIIVITIIACVGGYVLNKGFEDKYFEPGIQWAPFALQCLFVFLAALTIPDSYVSGWFILWVICTIVSYALGLYMCYHHAITLNAEKKDIKFKN